MATFMLLPDELLMQCVGGSLCLCTRLATASYTMRCRLRKAAKLGLRYVCSGLSTAIAVQDKTVFNIGELVLTSDEWPFIHDTSVAMMLENCTRLRTVRVNPCLANKVAELYATQSDSDKQLDFKGCRDIGYLEIVARSVSNRVKPSQQRLTNMEWLIGYHGKTSAAPTQRFLTGVWSPGTN